MSAQAANGALDQHYEVVGRILVKMASLGLKRIEDIHHGNAVELFGKLSDSPTADSEVYQDVLEWTFAEDLLRRSSGGSKREGVYVFNNVQLTAKGIGVIEANPRGGFGLSKSIKETEKTEADLSPNVYAKIGSFVGGLLGGFTTSIS